MIYTDPNKLLDDILAHPHYIIKCDSPVNLMLGFKCTDCEALWEMRITALKLVDAQHKPLYNKVVYDKDAFMAVVNKGIKFEQ